MLKVGFELPTLGAPGDYGNHCTTVLSRESGVDFVFSFLSLSTSCGLPGPLFLFWSIYKDTILFNIISKYDTMDSHYFIIYRFTDILNKLILSTNMQSQLSRSLTATGSCTGLVTEGPTKV